MINVNLDHMYRLAVRHRPAQQQRATTDVVRHAHSVTTRRRRRRTTRRRRRREGHFTATYRRSFDVDWPQHVDTARRLTWPRRL